MVASITCMVERVSSHVTSLALPPQSGGSRLSLLRLSARSCRRKERRGGGRREDDEGGERGGGLIITGFVKGMTVAMAKPAQNGASALHHAIDRS